jgi:hypothetical protein
MTRTAVAMAALLVAGQALGQETITLNGVARTVSLTTALYGCGRYYPINTPLIEKMASTHPDVIRTVRGVGYMFVPRAE